MCIAGYCVNFSFNNGSGNRSENYRQASLTLTELLIKKLEAYGGLSCQSQHGFLQKLPNNVPEIHSKPYILCNIFAFMCYLGKWKRQCRQMYVYLAFIKTLEML